MKKRMFLSTILMTLVLLLAVTTATFAWYQAQAGNVGYGSAPEQSVTTAANGYNAGGFQVNVAFGELGANAPVLTDASGKTYYYAGDKDGAEILDSSAAPKSNTVAFTVTVTYTGDITDDDALADLWTQLGENVKVTFTDGSTGAHITAGGGLKFWKDATHQTEWAEGAANVVYTFANAPIEFTDGSATIGSGTLYYGAKGVNDFIQTPADAYKIVATAAKNA